MNRHYIWQKWYNLMWWFYSNDMKARAVYTKIGKCILMHASVWMSVNSLNMWWFHFQVYLRWIALEMEMQLKCNCVCSLARRKSYQFWDDFQMTWKHTPHIIARYFLHFVFLFFRLCLTFSFLVFFYCIQNMPNNSIEKMTYSTFKATLNGRLLNENMKWNLNNYCSMLMNVRCIRRTIFEMSLLLMDLNAFISEPNSSSDWQCNKIWWKII